MYFYIKYISLQNSLKRWRYYELRISRVTMVHSSWGTKMKVISHAPLLLLSLCQGTQSQVRSQTKISVMIIIFNSILQIGGTVRIPLEDLPRQSRTDSKFINNIRKYTAKLINDSYFLYDFQKHLERKIFTLNTIIYL